jgi:DNA-binding NtrC family response regulator
LPIDRGPLRKPDTELRHKIRSGTGRLLVVDDLDLVLEFATSFLTQAGYQVVTATSAEAALKILANEKRPVDLLLTDYAMPNKNGWQLIQEVQARWPGVKCLLASDTSMTPNARKSQQRADSGQAFGIAEATTVIAEILKAIRSRPAQTRFSSECRTVGSYCCSKKIWRPARPAPAILRGRGSCYESDEHLVCL